MMVGVRAGRIELDENWGYVGKKQKRVAMKSTIRAISARSSLYQPRNHQLPHRQDLQIHREQIAGPPTSVSLLSWLYPE